MSNPSTLAQPGPQYAPQPRNGLGTAALVLGIIACAFGLMPITGWLAIILALIGLPLGIAGAVRVYRHKADNKVITWVGAGLSTLGLVLGIWATTMMVQITDDFVRDMDSISRDLEQDLGAVPPAPSLNPAPVVEPAADPAIDGYTDGQYLVGTDIEPGTYKSDGGETMGCYWMVYADGTSNFEMDNVVNSHYADGPTRVTLTDGQLAEFQGCMPFTKVG